MRKGHFDAYRLGPSESVAKPIIDAPLDQQVRAVTHDGKRILVSDAQADGTLLLTIAAMESPSKRTTVPIQASTIEELEFSPDDKWFAVQTTASGRNQIVVMPTDPSGAVVPITSDGGTYPRWAPTGSTLYYERDDQLIAVTYSTSSGRFTVSREDVLFKLGGHHLIDAAPDGRFLVMKASPGQTPGIQVVVNWLSELKR